MLNRLVTFVFCGLLAGSSLVIADTETLPILSGVGGNFSAVDANGNNFEYSSLTGNVVVLAFGYTNCADICPFTLGYLKRLYGNLSTDEQQKLRIIFVTIDPEYDTPGHLKAFVGHFNEDFIGLSGSQQQIDYIVSLFQAQYQTLSEHGIFTQNIRRVTPKLFADTNDAEQDKASLYSHTVTLYLADKEGSIRSLEYTGTPLEEFTNKIRLLINE